MQLFLLSPNKDALFAPELIERLESVADVVIDTVPKPFAEVAGLYTSEEEKILAIDPDFCEWNFPTEEALQNIKNLRAICLATTSFSWLDTAQVATAGIPVTNLRGFSTEAVAEYVVLMTLAVARKLPVVVKDNFKQDFVKHQGVELKGRTVAVIGLGRIGSRIAELMQGLGMKVVYWSKHDKGALYERQELETIFKTADVIIPALAQNEDTTSLITDDMLRSMKSDAMFISIVHKVYNHELLLSLAREGKIHGYAFEGDNESLMNYEGNVFAIPAVAWATDGAMRVNGEMWTEALLAAAQNNYPTKVN